MLLSMTGHGDATIESDGLSVTAEVRSVNNRHLKVSVRCPDGFLALESNVERLVRQRVSRGTVNVSLHVRRNDIHETGRLDRTVLEDYWNQLTTIASELKAEPPKTLETLLSLPGVVEEGERRIIEESDWPVLETAVGTALDRLNEFRVDEGRAMATELATHCDVITSRLDEVVQRAPQVVSDYRERVRNRVNDLLRESDVRVADSDLLRELSIFADRCDITEEITRLRSHLEQFRSLLTPSASAGRKLEFLCQEMFREVNTIGSKANDVTIAHHVVDMKSAVEKMREIVQNIE